MNEGQSKGANNLSTNTQHRQTGETGGTHAPDGLSGTRALEELVLHALDDDKAEEVVSIDLTGKSSVTDIMIIASGRSNRHVGAIADHLIRRLKDAGHGKVQVEGLQTCDWVLIDAGDVIIHIFRPEVRVFYDLEKMWSAAPGGAS